ncbi:class E sortase [Sinomonas mesophila]|uniref:class E sortase n=1 Tax=Sinomonas mesophila TaxID=1531955 RepID=UPI001FEBD26C|nr:class E sortase [Sinomonas mesophila]
MAATRTAARRAAERGSDRPHGRRRPARGAFALQVLGELLLTVGAIVVLFVVWQLWWTNVEADARQGAVVREFAQEIQAPAQPPATPAPTPPDYGPAPVPEGFANGDVIGVMYIPRFGENYTRPVLEGVGRDVLDTLGLGHYPMTTLPGAPGNFALAGHRQTHGAVLDNIDQLQPGDRIYLQTRDAYYTYVFRNSEIVLPTATDILLPVPHAANATPTESLLTLTTCHPRYGNQQRFIAYSVLDSWQPASAGPPAEIAARVAAAMGGS